MHQKKSRLTYKEAGVDIEAGNQLVRNIKGAARRTNRPGVFSGLGGFGALFEVPKGFKEPILVSGADGVGTKLRLAIEYDMHQRIGIDLVAMCANDIVVCGAEPLFFLDYYATAKLDLTTAESVINGIADGCQIAGCALIGGETAEMPGMYSGKDYDLAGFCVGIVEKSKIIDGNGVLLGNKLIGIKSSGPHSNGYSLIRKILDHNKINATDLSLSGKSLIEHLMEPTKIYAKVLLKLNKILTINAIAHITGGGLVENLARVIPNECKGIIDCSSWQMPEIFDWLQNAGNIDDQEMYKTFNCGIGMVLCVPAEGEKDFLAALELEGEQAYVIGDIVKKAKDEDPVELVREQK